MTACKIRGWSVPDSAYAGVSRAMAHCEAHDWRFEGGCASGMCPVGRIEKAVEDGVNRIVEAIKEQKP